MSAKEYMESGMVQDYCLGLLRGHEKREFETAMRIYPMLYEAVIETQKGLENYASQHAIDPPAQLKDQIWQTLDNLNQEAEMDLQYLPLISKYTDHNKWLSVVKPLLPKQVGEDKFLHVLQHTDKVTQILAMSSTDFEDEVHDDLLESFIILEGECECYVGEEKIRLGAGGYLEIPLYTSHDVKLLTPHVTAVIQRIAV